MGQGGTREANAHSNTQGSISTSSAPSCQLLNFFSVVMVMSFSPPEGLFFSVSNCTVILVVVGSKGRGAGCICLYSDKEFFEEKAMMY